MDGRKDIHAYARMARAHRWLISRVARTRHVRVCASGVCARGTTLARRRHNSLENVWRLELLNPRVRTHGARAWMVENAGSARTRHVRVRVDGALFFKKKISMFLHQSKHSKPPNSYQNTIKPYLTYLNYQTCSTN